MIYTSKSTLSLDDLKILSPKVTKNLTNLHNKFCESPPWPRRDSSEVTRVKLGYNEHAGNDLFVISLIRYKREGLRIKFQLYPFIIALNLLLPSLTYKHFSFLMIN